MSLKICVILAIIPAIMGITDYCDEELCRYYSESDNTTVVIAHIACNNTGEFAAECIEPEMIDMNDQFIQFIVDLHNTLRNDLACGNVSNLPTAAKMPTLTWNKEFAELASLAAKQCEGIRDKCRNTEKFHYVGQNIGQVLVTTNETDYQLLVKLIITQWFNEFVYCKNDTDIEKYHSAADAKETYEHFAVMSSDKVADIGCAAIKFRSTEQENVEHYKSIMVLCNYGYSNFIGRPVYTIGKPASECKTGANPKLPGLCSVDEEVVSKPDVATPAN